MNEHMYEVVGAILRAISTLSNIFLFWTMIFLIWAILKGAFI